MPLTASAMSAENVSVGEGPFCTEDALFERGKKAVMKAIRLKMHSGRDEGEEESFGL